jgi:hypothetical protein
MTNVLRRKGILTTLPLSRSGPPSIKKYTFHVEKYLNSIQSKLFGESHLCSEIFANSFGAKKKNGTVHCLNHFVNGGAAVHIKA